jgi:anti-sigma factor ChrR (cupin superfamily)
MLDNALRHNQAFLDEIIAFINTVEEEDPAYVPNQETSRNNRSKIKTTLKQFFREWCGESVEKQDYVRMAEKCR